MDTCVLLHSQRHVRHAQTQPRTLVVHRHHPGKGKTVPVIRLVDRMTLKEMTATITPVLPCP